MKGNYTTDFTQANDKATKPKGNDTTWHHHEDAKKIQEVDSDVHDRFTHHGGCSKKKK